VLLHALIQQAMLLVPLATSSSVHTFYQRSLLFPEPLGQYLHNTCFGAGTVLTRMWWHAGIQGSLK